MPDGFFLGGMAEGQQQAAQMGLAERAQALQEQGQQYGMKRDLYARADGQLAEGMKLVSETANALSNQGVDNATIAKQVQPIMQSLKSLAAKADRDPALLDAQLATVLASPSIVQQAKVAGTAEGTKIGATQVTAQKEITGAPGEAGGEAPPTLIIDPAKRSEAEGKLRDDYVNRNKEFITLRDFKDRMDSAAKTGAGDMALVFSFMKVLDPTSSVREGEYATAQNAAGIPEAVRGMLNKMIGEGKLSETARKEIIAESESIWRKASERQSNLTNQFRDIAKRYGLNPKNVIVDFNPSSSGTSITTPGGTTFTVGH